MSTFSQKLRNARINCNYTLAQAATLCNLNYKTLYNYESGISRPDIEKLAAICKAYNVSADYFIDVNIRRDDIMPQQPESASLTKEIPLFGSIACGEPIYADNNIEGYLCVDQSDDVDFAITARGDSMINARIFDGDLVFIKQQSVVENGEIAAVLIDDEATLKRFYRYNDMVILRPENPKYNELIFRQQDLVNIQILGKAVFLKAYLSK